MGGAARSKQSGQHRHKKRTKRGRKRSEPGPATRRKGWPKPCAARQHRQEILEERHHQRVVDAHTATARPAIAPSGVSRAR
eukprot:11209963-Lingulodinium_polyedra.AAC.1